MTSPPGNDISPPDKDVIPDMIFYIILDMIFYVIPDLIGDLNLTQ